MKNLHAIGLLGAGLGIAGWVFLMKDPKFFAQWYEWIVGPFLWMIGSSLIAAWALGCLLDVSHHVSKPVQNAVFGPIAEDLPGMDMAG